MTNTGAHVDNDLNWNVVYQIVVLAPYRQHLLCVAHDHQFANHLGITKTYKRILCHFFLARVKNMLLIIVALVIPVKLLANLIKWSHLLLCLLYLQLENHLNM